LVSGAVADLRGRRIHGNEYLLWIDSVKVAFLDIEISRNNIVLKFQRSYGGVDADPIVSATIAKNKVGVNSIVLNGL
jgi:hypothetical protein